jgi:energy-coupling factor transport system permease protein
LHPLVKLGWLLLGTVLVFAVQSPWVVLAILGGLGWMWRRLAPGRVRGLRLAVGTALALAALQIAFQAKGILWVQVGPLRVTDGGVQTGVYIGGRFLSVVLMSYLFVLTTDPNALAYALMQAGVPYRFGFALVTALRLVPVFEQEGETVYRAQMARGVAYNKSGPRRWVTLARQFLLPLLVSALSKVDALAVSMEGRGFGQYPRRTFLRELEVTRVDGIAVGLLFVLTAVWVGIAIVGL